MSQVPYAFGAAGGKGKRAKRMPGQEPQPIALREQVIHGQKVIVKVYAPAMPVEQALRPVNPMREDAMRALEEANAFFLDSLAPVEGEKK